ncbi:MAG: hypothetical protein ACK5FE_05175 [Cyanobacteriota bacterium]|jgi:hypothetical protein
MGEAAGEQLLGALLDGPFRRLRDDNHVDPHRILVWDEQQQPVIQALSILEVLGRYPCGDVEDAQWSADDLLEILQRKRELLRRSLVAHDIADGQDDAQPTCGTVVLIINPNSEEPHRWVAVLSRVLPR